MKHIPKALKPLVETAFQTTHFRTAALAVKVTSLALFLLTLSVTTHAQLTYTIENGVVTITGYSGNIPSLTIPGTIAGLPVKAIRERAFFFRTDLESLIIPDSVTTIGDNAFSYCSGLISVVIPPGVTRIQYGTFSQCTGLSSVIIPDGVTMIGDFVFDSCASLGAVRIPKTVNIIGDGAFWRCTGLTNVTIPNGVTSIGGSTFAGCTGLTSVILPDDVNKIGISAFSGCSGLSSVTIPSRLEVMGSAAFIDCSQLKSAYFRGNRPELGPQTSPNPKFPMPPIPSFAGTAATLFYLPGTTGWGPEFAGRPTALWNPSASTADSSSGLKSGNFGFNISGSNDIEVVVEACTDLSLPAWLPVGTNTLASGSSYFADSAWTNHPSRFYRFRSP